MDFPARSPHIDIRLPISLHSTHSVSIHFPRVIISILAGYQREWVMLFPNYVWTTMYIVLSSEHDVVVAPHVRTIQREHICFPSWAKAHTIVKRVYKYTMCIGRRLRGVVYVCFCFVLVLLLLSSLVLLPHIYILSAMPSDMANGSWSQNRANENVAFCSKLNEKKWFMYSLQTACSSVFYFKFTNDKNSHGRFFVLKLISSGKNTLRMMICCAFQWKSSRRRCCRWSECPPIYDNDDAKRRSIWQPSEWGHRVCITDAVGGSRLRMEVCKVIFGAFGLWHREKRVEKNWFFVLCVA